MTEEAHCYENARTKQVNGILKPEYGLGGSFKGKADAIRAIDEAVLLFNTKRLIRSIPRLSPHKISVNLFQHLTKPSIPKPPLLIY